MPVRGDQFKHEGANLQFNSINNISTIALELGEERTRNELIPRLTKISYDEDEDLLALTELLGTFTKITTTMLLPKILLLVDDPVGKVRFRVARTLQKISPFVDSSVVRWKVEPALDTHYRTLLVTKIMSETSLDLVNMDRKFKSVTEMYEKRIKRLETYEILTTD